MSVGGRAFPPPKYCSYSIFNWRMSLSSWLRSSSTVLAMEYWPHNIYGKALWRARSTHSPNRGAEQVILPNNFTGNPQARVRLVQCIALQTWTPGRSCQEWTYCEWPQKSKGARFRAPSSNTPIHPIPEHAGTCKPPRENQNHLCSVVQTKCQRFDIPYNTLNIL